MNNNVPPYSQICKSKKCEFYSLTDSKSLNNRTYRFDHCAKYEDIFHSGMKKTWAMDLITDEIRCPFVEDHVRWFTLQQI